MTTRPLLGITMGDPTGVGAELTAMVVARGGIQTMCRPLVIGDLATMKAAVEIVGVSLDLVAVSQPREAEFAEGRMNVLDLKNVELDKLVRGTVDPMGGKVAYECVKKAVDLALAGEIDAIVTGPLHKEALHKAGYDYAGHTEILSDACNTPDVTMMLTSAHLRVSHVSTHVSLREAIDRVKKDRIVRVIRLTDEALRRMGIQSPSIGVAGLNPHASDGGLFGNEERLEIEPAVREARAMGLDVTGPVPPDALFYRAVRGSEIGRTTFDAVVAMYHDQGHIPIKLLGLLDGVNVTLGLPIIRTSVDHGTAFGKAGKGTANPTSLVEAIKLAVAMANGRNKQKAS